MMTVFSHSFYFYNQHIVSLIILDRTTIEVCDGLLWDFPIILIFTEQKKTNKIKVMAFVQASLLTSVPGL